MTDNDSSGGAGSRGRTGPRTRTKLKLALAGILLVLVLVLVVQNQEPVSTEVLLWTFEAPRFALLATVFLGGILVGYLFGRTTRIELGGRG